MNSEYEIVIAGGGPAGLSAARTAARLGFHTLLLERLSQPGEMAHPCSGVVAPLPGLVSVEAEGEGLRYPEVDLHLPPSLIVGYPVQQRVDSPGGYEVAVDFGGSDGLPIAVIDPAGLLRLLAEQAQHAGADLSYSTAVTGLWQEGGRIAGVHTTRGDVRAQVVLSAEGTARRLCEEAGLYGKQPRSRRYAYVVSQQLEAPAVRVEHLGQILTLGRRFTSAQESFGTVVLPAPGRASVYFTVFADRPANVTVQSCWKYLDEYMQNDPRVSPYFEGARIAHRFGYRMVLRDAPQRVLRDGFMGLGDALTPGGHLGILPAIYGGRHAALIAAGAIDAGDTSAAGLAAYGSLFHGPILNSLEAESRLMMGLTGMADTEIDRLCQTLQALRLVTPQWGNWRTIAWDTIGWLYRQFPLITRDWETFRRVLRGNVRPEGDDELLPVRFDSMGAWSGRPLAHAAGSGPVPPRFRVLS